MKPTNVLEKKRIKQNVREGAKAMELNSAGIVHIMSVLTNLYSNPRTAVIREYLSNAIDAQRGIGNLTKPIEITIPVQNTVTESSPLIIRDFGPGMDADQIDELYRKYGSSTKQDDNGQIGGFGIGGKSALAISDTFTGISYQNGKQISFVVEKYDDMPTLDIEDSVDTDEADGFKVVIPFSPISSIKEIKDLFTGMDIPIIVNGELFSNTITNPAKFISIMGLDGLPVGWIEKEVEESISRYSPVKILVGGVVYTIESRQVPAYLEEVYNKLTALRGGVIDFYIKVPVGSVKLTPSREELVFSDKTNDTLFSVFSDFVYSLQNWFASYLNKLNTRKEVYDFADKYAAIFRSFSETPKWRGETIKLAVTKEEYPGMYHFSLQNKKKTSRHVAKIIPGYFTNDYSNRMFMEKFDIVLTAPKAEIDNNAAYHYLLQFMTTINNYTAYNSVYLIPETLVSDKWFEFYPGISTAKNYLDFIEETKEAKKTAMALKRSRSKDSSNARNSEDFKYRVLNTDSEKVFLDIIYSNDERIKQAADGNIAVYYTNNLVSTFGSSRSQCVIADIKNSASRLVFLNESVDMENSIVFALNTRQSVDAFLRMFPNAVNISKKVDSFLTKKYDEINSLPWNVIENAFSDYHVVRIIRNIIESYKTYLENGGNNKVAELDYLSSLYPGQDRDSVKANAELEENAAYMRVAHFANHADITKIAYRVYPEVFSLDYSKFNYFVHAMSHGEAKNNIKFIDLVLENSI